MMIQKVIPHLVVAAVMVGGVGCRERGENRTEEGAPGESTTGQGEPGPIGQNEPIEGARQGEAEPPMGQPGGMEEPGEGAMGQAGEVPLNANDIFARATLSSVEGEKGIVGHARFYGQPGKARLTLTLMDAQPGTYAVMLGKDCKPASAQNDTNAADDEGVGSATVRAGEPMIGTLTVGADKRGELDAMIPAAYAEQSAFEDRALIVTPEAGAGTAQTKIACGTIDVTAKKEAS